jgi:hypothetical protein
MEGFREDALGLKRLGEIWLRTHASMVKKKKI